MVEHDLIPIESSIPNTSSKSNIVNNKILNCHYLVYKQSRMPLVKEKPHKTHIRAHVYILNNNKVKHDSAFHYAIIRERSLTSL